MKIFPKFSKLKILFHRHHASNRRYMKRQMRDIKEYGEKFVPITKDNVNLAKEIEEITPFRRRSERGSSLEDPLWHIQKFEEEKGAEYLPVNWANMTVQEKADYIVSYKYSNLVARKIMKRIKDEPLEHEYTLRYGDIVGHEIGTDTSVSSSLSNAIIGDTGVHNHPLNLKIKKEANEKERAFLEMLCPGLYRTSGGFSGADIVSSTLTRQKSYVIDSNGHIFVFEPKRNPVDIQEQLRYASFIREKFKKLDIETDTRQSIGLARFCAFILQQTGRTSQKDAEEAAEFCKHYAADLSNIFIGQAREKIFRSEDFIKKIMDKVGKLWFS
jgi:hypothetical protein